MANCNSGVNNTFELTREKKIKKLMPALNFVPLSVVDCVEILKLLKHINKVSFLLHYFCKLTFIAILYLKTMINISDFRTRYN